MTNFTNIGSFLTRNIILIFLYRVYLKCLVKLQEFFRIRTKRKVHKTYVQKWVDFISIKKFKKKCFNYVTFYFRWHNTLAAHDIYIYIYIYIYVESLLFVKSQFTTSTQNFLHLNRCTHGKSWSRNVAPFQRSRGSCDGLTGINNASVKCLFLFSVCLHRQKCRGVKACVVGPYFKN
jgi:hypothetical protein